MELTIKRDSNIPNKVLANMIHGKFPYKMYLQMMGNSVYGDYISIISNTPIKQDGDIVDRVAIQLENRVSDNSKNTVQGIRPNTFDSILAKYKVKEVNVLEVGQTPLLVFKPITTEE